MPARDVERLPPFPQPPAGVARLEHLPTVEASIRYWEAIRVQAIRSRDPAPRMDCHGVEAFLRGGPCGAHKGETARRPKLVVERSFQGRQRTSVSESLRSWYA